MARARRPSPAVARTIRLVVSSAPPAEARRLARVLVTGRLAACVHVVPAGTSVYRWRGKIERAAESVMLVKTTKSALARCLRALAAAHSYEVPEALVLAPTDGLAEYARWVAESCSPRRA